MSALLIRIKRWVEAKSGLGLSDALNVCLFLLTVISFVVAVGGVYVAYVTLAEARRAGEEQEKATHQAQWTLDQSKDALLAAKGVMEQTLKAAQQENALLTQSAGTARQMESALNNIKEQPNAVAILSVQLTCKTLAVGRHSTDTGPLVGYEDKVRFHLTSVAHHGYLSFFPGTEYSCGLHLQNKGDRALDTYSVRFIFLPNNDYTLQFSPVLNPSWQNIPEMWEGLEVASGHVLAPATRDTGADRFFLLRLVPRRSDGKGDFELNTGTIWLRTEGTPANSNVMPIIVSRIIPPDSVPE